MSIQNIIIGNIYLRTCDLIKISFIKKISILPVTKPEVFDSLSFSSSNFPLFFFFNSNITDIQDISVQFSSVQSLSRVWLFATPWTAPRQASLSITNSWSLLKLMSIESMMPSSHLILCLRFQYLKNSVLRRSEHIWELVQWRGKELNGISYKDVFPCHCF